MGIFNDKVVRGTFRQSSSALIEYSMFHKLVKSDGCVHKMNVQGANQHVSEPVFACRSSEKLFSVVIYSQ